MSIKSRSADSFSQIVQLLSAYVVVYAVWTLIVHAAVVLKLGFQHVLLLSPLLLIAAPVGWFLGRNGPAGQQAAPAGTRDSRPRLIPWLLAATAITAIYAVSVHFKASWASAAAFKIFWGSAVAYLLFAVCKTWQATGNPAEPKQVAARRRDLILLALIALLAAAVPFFFHRPDIDDSFYLALANQAITHPEIPILRHDALLDLPQIPIMLGIYQLHSFELFQGLVAWLCRCDPIGAAHLILPPVWAALSVLAGAAFFRMLLPRNWLAATVVAFVLTFALGGDHHSVANFSFLRLQQGKAVLLSLQVPLLFVFGWRFTRSGRLADWLLLLAGQIGAVGLSSTGIVVVPAAAAIALASGTAGLPWRVLVRRLGTGLLTLAYPVTCAALVVTAARGKIDHFPAAADLTLPQSIAAVLDQPGQYLLLWGLLMAWIALPSIAARRAVLVAALLYFVSALNPLFWRFVVPFTTPASWRMLWFMPVLLIAACGVTALVVRLPRARGVAIAVLCGGALALSFHFNTFLLRPSNYVSCGAARLDADQPEFDLAARIVVTADPRETVLAPETLSSWICTIPRHPPLVYVRESYLLLQRDALGDDEFNARFRLCHLLSSNLPADVPYLLAEADRLHIGCIALDASASATAAYDEALAARGWHRLAAPGYHVWIH